MRGPEDSPVALPVKTDVRCRRLPVTATKQERIERHAAKIAYKKERDRVLGTGLYPGHLWRLP